MGYLLKNGNFINYFKPLKKFDKAYDRDQLFYVIRSIYESLPIKFKNYFKNYQLLKDTTYLKDRDDISIPFYINYDDDSFFNNYFNFIYNWVFPYISDIEDKIFSYYNLVYRAPFTDFDLIKIVYNKPINETFSLGTKSLLKANTKINYPDQIKSDGQKRSFPGGLHQFVSKSKDLIFDEISSNSKRVDFIDDVKFTKSSYELFNNGEYGKLFRRFSLINWYNSSDI